MVDYEDLKLGLKSIIDKLQFNSKIMWAFVFLSLLAYSIYASNNNIPMFFGIEFTRSKRTIDESKSRKTVVFRGVLLNFVGLEVKFAIVTTDTW